MDSKYLYRIDTIRTLKMIQKKGFRCDTPSRITHLGLKSETERAREEGLRIPPVAIMEHPRGYFLETLQHAEYELNYFHTYDFISRYSRKNYPFSSNDMIFPDGAWRSGAVYVIFENSQVDDIVVLPKNIEIMVKNKWRRLSNFNFESLKYVRCSRCWKYISKKIIKKKGYKGEYQSGLFYCEPCCVARRRVF